MLNFVTLSPRCLMLSITLHRLVSSHCPLKQIRWIPKFLKHFRWSKNESSMLFKWHLSVKWSVPALMSPRQLQQERQMYLATNCTRVDRQHRFPEDRRDVFTRRGWEL